MSLFLEIHVEILRDDIMISATYFQEFQEFQPKIVWICVHGERGREGAKVANVNCWIQVEYMWVFIVDILSPFMYILKKI